MIPTIPTSIMICLKFVLDLYSMKNYDFNPTVFAAVQPHALAFTFEVNDAPGAGTVLVGQLTLSRPISTYFLL